jgi:hypothetical protein
VKEVIMADNYDELRKFKRYDVDGMHGRIHYSADINILNISMDGAAISTTQRLVLDRVYSIKLKFEDAGITMKGKVVWSLLSHSNTLENGEVVPVYKAGMKFTNVMTDVATRLNSYIEKNRTGAVEKRVLGVRFKVSNHESAEIGLPCEYVLKRVSLSGMLIETDAVFEVETRHEMELNLDGSSLILLGRIANVAEVKVDDAIKYEVGIEFVKVPDEEMKILQSYISSREKKG